jgi:hypothetical protein
MTKLNGLFAWSAIHASDEQVMRMVRALEGEPDQANPHIAQALEAFTDEARRRGLLSAEDTLQ